MIEDRIELIRAIRKITNCELHPAKEIADFMFDLKYRLEILGEDVLKLKGKAPRPPKEQGMVMYNEGIAGWITHIPTAGGWWEIQHHSTGKYYLFFVAVAAIGDVIKACGEFDSLSSLLKFLTYEQFKLE